MFRSTLAALLLAASPALAAAPGDWVEAIKPVPAPPLTGEIILPLTGPAALSPAPQEAWAGNGGQRMVYNVTRPTLIPFPSAPGAGKGSQPAVILVPGGGFEFLSMDNEGFGVAKRLTKLGVRVFILKYRTLPLPGGFEGFKEALGVTFQGKTRPAGPIDIQADIPAAVADAQTALRTVRKDAAKWHVDPAHVGLLGFSAGAMTTLAMTQANAPDARPDFVGLIYGPTRAGPVPKNAPPLFAALAADDRFFGKDDFGLIEGWRKSGASVELHLYSAGGHGFASTPNRTTSDDWFNQYALWLKAQKITGR